MHILIVSQYFWPENFRINDLALALVDSGYEVTVLTGIPNYPEGSFYSGYRLRVKKESYQNINIVRVPIIPRGTASNLMLFLNYISFVFSASLIAPFLIKGKVDKIFIFGGSPLTKAIPAIFLSKLKKAKLFLWVLDLWPESVFVNNRIHSKFIFGLIRRMMKRIYKHTDYILLQSKAMFSSVEQYGIKKDKLVYFPSWAEDQFLDLPKCDREREVIDSLPSGFYVTFAGNIGEGQDIETIIDAAEELGSDNQIHWLFLGYGTKYEWLVENKKERKLSNVHILGKKPLESMPIYYEHADVLLASLKKKDIYALTLPGKVQSYMASSKPIIAMIDGESSRIIKESKSGISLASEDKKGLVNAVVQMSKMSSSELDQMGKNGRKYYLENFHINKALSTLNQLFSDSK